MKSARGFSLIELMIAVAIVGILAAIALPSYNKSVIKANRAAAKATLMEIAGKQQQVLLDRRSYVSGDTTTSANKASLESSLGVKISDEFDRYYTLTVTYTAGPPPSFTAKADPRAGKKQSSDGWLQVDQAGTRTSQYSDRW